MRSMDASGIAWVGVAAATVVAFVANFLWFGPRTLFPVWWRALGNADLPPGADGTSMAVTFGLTTVAVVVQAVAMTFVLRGAALLAGVADVSIGHGALVGAVVGVAIAATTSLGHRLFSGQGLVVWAIEVGGDVLGLTLMGAVLAAWY